LARLNRRSHRRWASVPGAHLVWPWGYGRGSGGGWRRWAALREADGESGASRADARSAALIYS